jgi:hypothetical protein
VAHLRRDPLRFIWLLHFERFRAGSDEGQGRLSADDRAEKRDFTHRAARAQ